MEAAGWLAHYAPNQQLAVELTGTGRDVAEPLYQAARDDEISRQRQLSAQSALRQSGNR
jgi:chemotaxis response regulator CheB